MMIEKNKIYQHYKDKKLYRVLAIAKHTETEEIFVAYESLESGDCWVRPADMFAGTVKHNNKSVYRFQYKGKIR